MVDTKINFGDHEKMKNLCRFCLVENTNNQWIFSVENEEFSLDFRIILKIHSGVQIAENDGLPSGICSKCLFEFKSAHQLWKQCQDADKKLRIIYSKREQNYEIQENDFAMQKTNSGISPEKSTGIHDFSEIFSNSGNSESEKSIITKRDFLKPRRVTLMKRILAMENLKNQKQRQRQFMKKSDNPVADNSGNVNIGNSVDKLSISYKCSQCSEIYSTKKSLNEHIRTHECNFKEKLIGAVCRICEKSFRKTETMIRHLNVHKKTQSKDVYLILKEIREKKTQGNSITLQNVKNEDNKIAESQQSEIKMINSWIREELEPDKEGKSFSCKICRKSYSTRKSLIKHEQKNHENQKLTSNPSTAKNEGRKNGIDEFKCETCEKTFEKLCTLRRHQRIHEKSTESDSNFKRFLCHICSKTFRQNTGLMFHMRTHTGYKPHACKFCGRGFTSNSNCINHERTHTGDRPFVCHFCSAAFAKSCTLKSHITTHTGEANYHCKTCGKSFRRLKYLKEHSFTHTGEKPYACKICGTAYSHSGSLFVHEKKCKAQFNSYQSQSINSDISSNQICSENGNNINIVSEKNSEIGEISRSQNTSNIEFSENNGENNCDEIIGT